MAALHATLLSRPAAPQPQCPLFATVPAEVRTQIFTLALSDYPDPSPDRRYKNETCYTRPSYFAQRRSDTELLRTCRAIYRECWFLPFILMEQTHWLTSADRAPPEYDLETSKSRLSRRMERIIEEQNDSTIGISGLRVFAQMYILEGGALADLLSTPYLNPRSLTLTIRHADWWFWENDEPLRFEGDWIKEASKCLPQSVQEIHIELESLERKKSQIDGIAKQMCERWFFKREDGTVFYADVTGKSNEVTRWSGRSIWNGKRWTRDEAAPGRLDYYVVDVVFRLGPAVERRGGMVSELARKYAGQSSFSYRKLKLHLPSVEANGTEQSSPSMESDASYDSEDSSSD